MTSRPLNALVLLIVIGMSSGCKLSVISTPYGDITATNPAHNCASGVVCELDLAAGFSETFTATAKPGYEFVKWQTGSGAGNGGFLCANSTNSACTVALPNDAGGVAIATLQDNGFLMPLFKQL